MQVSCIIPFYNEDGRIENILTQVVKISNIRQIIAVDDGSDHDHTGALKKLFPKISFLRLEKNSGKSQAVRQGLKIANNDYILLLDADLRRFKFREVQQAIDVLSKNTNIDMLILRRINAPFYIKVLRGDVLVSGERIIRKSDLVRILNQNINRYQLESAINLYMFNSNKQVLWYPYSGLNTFKTKKWGLSFGLLGTATAQFEILSGSGILNYLRHIIFFARNQIR